MVAILKKIIFKLYVIGLMCFTAWYGYFMYPLIFGFEGKEEAAESLKELGQAGTEEEQMFVKLIAEQTHQKKTDLGYRVIEQPYIEGRFHHIGFQIQEDKASTCVRCHGNVPHDKSKEIRSFLNMHTFYLACETCHSQPEKGKPKYGFGWYNKDNGQFVGNPKALLKIEESFTSIQEKRQFPIYGNYGAKIAPRASDGSLLHGAKEMAFVERFLSEQERLKPEKKSQMKLVIHRKVSTDPVACSDCHQDTGYYIPFDKLGYPPTRMRELTNTAVVGMIDKYKEFYIPNFLEPGGGKRNNE